MTNATTNAKSSSDQPWGKILGRVTAAIFGGYALAYYLGAAVAKLLPMEPSEAVYLTSMLQICLYVGVVLWAFSVTAKRAWATLAILSGLCAAVAYFG